MTFVEIQQALRKQFPDAFPATAEETPAYLNLVPDAWPEVARFLSTQPELKFDSLQCITGVDFGPGQHLEVRYNLHSMVHNHTLEIRIALDREHPEVPSIEQIWRIGDWFERETYDLYGIVFSGHRDLRRILLPEDWEGWPLRKDYETPETYHGIVIPKEKPAWE